MAKSKDDIKYGTSQARLSEDEAVRVAYKHGTPLEGGKIAESETIDVFSSARNVSKGQDTDFSNTDQSQLQQRNTADTEGGEGEGGGGSSTMDFSTGAPRLPNKGPPLAGHKY